MIGFSVNEILAKTFFSKKNSKTPMYNAVISMIANICFAYLLSPRYGINGLALATAGGSTVNALLNYICMKKKYGKFLEKIDRISIVKTVISALIMAAAGFVLYRVLSDVFAYSVVNCLITGIICAAAGLLVYGICCVIFGVDEIKMLIKR